MRKIIIGKVLLTYGGVWNATTGYSKLTYVLHNGDGWWSAKANVNSEPSSSNTNWIQATDVQSFIAELQEVTESAQQLEEAIEVAEAIRVSSEQNRVSAEQNRVSAETSRANTESQRVLAEAARASAEQNRSLAEISRQNAETIRQQDEEERESAIATAIGLANTAASNADEKAEYAEAQGDYAKGEAEKVQPKLDAVDEALQEVSETMTAQAQAFSSAQQERAETFSQNEAARDAIVEEKVADITELQSDVAELESKKANKDGYYATLRAGLADELAINGKSLAKHTQVAKYETTGGSLSVKDGVGYIRTIKGTSEGLGLAGLTINSTGFNLIPSGSGTTFTFACVKGEWGSYGSASKNNGYLFSNNNGDIITPSSVKQNGANVPTHIEDGVTYYLPPQDGVMTVFFATSQTNPCCHLCWSNYRDTELNYETYSLSQISGFNNISIGDKILRRITSGQSFVVDELNLETKKAYRRIGNVLMKNLTWSMSQEETEGSTNYIFTANVSGGIASGDTMSVGGLYEVVGSTALNIYVDGNTAKVVSDTISSVDGLKNALGNIAMKYELATIQEVSITFTSTLKDEINISDFGIIYIENTANNTSFDVDFELQISWSDTLKNMMQHIEDEGKATASVLNNLNARIYAIERNINDGFSHIKVDDLFVGHSFKGAIFDDGDTMSRVIEQTINPNIIPKSVGQIWVNKTTKKVWYAVGNSAVSDFVVLN